jgi:tRNA(His) guanylyltransferase
MNSQDFEKSMRKLEIFHGYRVPEGCNVVVRLDGRSFSKLTKEYFKKPFDERFHDIMVKVTSELVKEFDANYAYTESDEISLLFGKDWDFCDRELEKIVSLTASYACSIFTANFMWGEKFDPYSSFIPNIRPIAFDSRVIPIVRQQTVADYFNWRQADATRCCLNGYAYHLLREVEGKTKGKAVSELNKADHNIRHEILKRNNMSFEELPGWQRNGTGIYRQYIYRDGFNPKTQQTIKARRRELVVNEDLPTGEEYRNLILKRVN